MPTEDKSSVNDALSGKEMDERPQLMKTEEQTLQEMKYWETIETPTGELLIHTQLAPKYNKNKKGRVYEQSADCL